MIKISNLVLKHPVFLAPMAGITNVNYRILARECGCALAFTEMVSSNGLVRRTPKTYTYLDSSPSDRPLGVQIFGIDPFVMAAAAAVVEEKGGDLIDINMGCPVKKVVKTGAGAALLRDPENAGKIIAAVRKATTLPLTIKIRTGWRQGQPDAFKIAHIAEEEGADALIVHPRTADQGFSGHSDWKVIREVKAKVKIPVIGNGDIREPEDAVRMLQETGCDAVMIGRASFGNPWIFEQILSLLCQAEEAGRPSVRDREMMLRRHLNMELAYMGEKAGLRYFRKHLLWYTKGLRGGASFRQTLGQIHEKEALLKIVDEYFATQISP